MNANELNALVVKITAATEIEDPGQREHFSGALREELVGLVTKSNEELSYAKGSYEASDLRLKQAEKRIDSERAKVKALADKLQERAAEGAPPTDPPLWALDFVLKWWGLERETPDPTLSGLVSDARSLVNLVAGRDHDDHGKGGSDG